MNKEDRWCTEDALTHYLDILIERARNEDRDIQRDTLVMLSLASMAYSLDYIEHRLVQIAQKMEKESCKR